MRIVSFTILLTILTSCQFNSSSSAVDPSDYLAIIKSELILLTPSPDQRVDILESNTELEQNQKQIIRLAAEYGVGLVDSYRAFKDLVIAGDSLSNYLAQVNHPNELGNKLIAKEILKYFK